MLISLDGLYFVSWFLEDPNTNAYKHEIDGILTSGDSFATYFAV